MTVELGLGAAEALAVPGRGRVVGVYPKAAYLRLEGGLIALTTPDVPSGPIHARTSVTLDRLQVGDPVVVTSTVLRAGPVAIDLRNVCTWQGALPAPEGLELAARVLEGAPASSLGFEPDAALLRRGDVGALAAQLGGVGLGLTPAGDDCLAGILLVARIRWGIDAEKILVGAATAVETNDIARAFLVWAARGQSIEPVHRFLIAVGAGDGARAGRALDALVGFGHTSGADLALGLRAAAQWLPGKLNP